MNQISNIISSGKTNKLTGSIFFGMILMGMIGAVFGGWIGIFIGKGVEPILASVIVFGSFLGFCGGVVFGLYAVIFRDFNKWDFFTHFKNIFSFFKILMKMNHVEIIKDSIYGAIYCAIIGDIVILVFMVVGILMFVAVGLGRFYEINFNGILILMEYLTIQGVVIGALFGKKRLSNPG